MMMGRHRVVNPRAIDGVFHGRSKHLATKNPQLKSSADETIRRKKSRAQKSPA
jgi:hypothetical protein